MKKVFINLVAFFAILNSFAQSYIPFDLENGVWYCYYDTKGGFFGQHDVYYARDSLKFYTDGNIIYNSYPCKRLYYIGYTESQIIPRTLISGYMGAIRNDTVNKKVYFNNSVMYDFNLSIGDSLILGFGYDYVVGIDSIEYCGRFHKRYELYNSNNAISTSYHIEGIGSSGGLFDMNNPTYVSWLMCYHEVGNSLCQQCPELVPVVEKQEKQPVQVFPNPTRGSFAIHSGSTIKKVAIYNSNGIPVSEIYRGFDEIVLDGPGIYLVKIESAGGVSFQKVIRY